MNTYFMVNTFCCMKLIVSSFCVPSKFVVCALFICDIAHNHLISVKVS